MIHVTSEPLFKILTLYPKATDRATQSLSKDFQNISDQDFRTAKNRIGLFKELIPLLENKNKPLELDERTYLQILEAVLKGDIEQVKANVQGNKRAGGGGNNLGSNLNLMAWASKVHSLVKTISGEKEVDGEVDVLIRHATEAAARVSDSEFLSQLGQDEERYAERFPHFKVLADRARNKAFANLEVTLARTLKTLTPAVHRIQVEECVTRIKHEHAKRAEEEQNRLRMNLINNLNDLSARTSYSCVSRWLVVIKKLTCLLVGIHCQSTTYQGTDIIVSACVVYSSRAEYSPVCRWRLFNIVSDLGFKSNARRPNGLIHSASHELDHTRSA